MNRWVFRCGCILEGQFVCLRAFCECISTVSTWQWVHARIKDALNSLLHHSGLHLLASIHLSLKHYTMGHHQTGPGSWNMPSFCVSKHFFFNACKKYHAPCFVRCLASAGDALAQPGWGQAVSWWHWCSDSPSQVHAVRIEQKHVWGIFGIWPRLHVVIEQNIGQEQLKWGLSLICITCFLLNSPTMYMWSAENKAHIQIIKQGA